MESNTEAIVRLAWTGILDLDDDALSARGEPRLRIVRPDADAVTFVRLFEQSILIGPEWLISAAANLLDDDLASVRTLLRLCADHRPQAIGEATLSYLDDYADYPGLEDAPVTDESEFVLAVEKGSAPDDVSEVGLSDMATQFVLLNDNDEPLAAAGYDIWGDIIAHLGVLTAHDQRRSGHGTVIAALASNAALDDGLVPQWRARTDNIGAARIAASLGFRQVGTQTTVMINEFPPS